MSSALMLIFAALTTMLIATGYVYVRRTLTYWKRKGVPCIEPSFPFGSLKDVFLQKTWFPDALQRYYESSDERVIGIYSLLRPMLLVRDPSLVRDILIKDFASFYHRGVHTNEKVDPMADNILLQNGDKWKTARTSLSPAFTSGKLKGMFDAIVSRTKSLNKYVGQYAGQNETLEVREVFARYATNVIASVAFGIEIDCIENQDSDFRKYGRRFFEASSINAIRSTLSVFAPLLAYTFRVRFVDKEVGDFMIDTVKRNLEYREKNNVQRKDIFQMLMQLRNTGKIEETNNWSAKSPSNEKSLSLEAMAAHAFLFFAGGYESSSTTMSFCMYELAKNPDAQQKAYEEIISTLEKHDEKISYESVSEMKFVDNCIEETLRMHAPFGILARQCTKDYKLSDSDIVIEKGTTVLISVNGLHYDNQYYEEPEKFNPERFDEKQNGNKTSVEMPFLSFGDGPRNCLGLRLGKLQSKLAVVTLLQKYRFELGEQHQNKELKMMIKSAAKCPENGINLKVISR